MATLRAAASARAAGGGARGRGGRLQISITVTVAVCYGSADPTPLYCKFIMSFHEMSALFFVRDIVIR